MLFVMMLLATPGEGIFVRTSPFPGGAAGETTPSSQGYQDWGMLAAVVMLGAAWESRSLELGPLLDWLDFGGRSGRTLGDWEPVPPFTPRRGGGRGRPKKTPEEGERAPRVHAPPRASAEPS